MTSAAEQIDQMRQSLEALESDLLQASGDPNGFSKLTARRSAMQRELARLEFLARKEQAEQEAAHMAAVRERLDDLIGRAAELRREGTAIDAQAASLIDQLDGLFAHLMALSHDHRKLEGAAENARRQLGLPGARPQIGPYDVPSRELVLRLWGLANLKLAAARLRPEHPAALSARQAAINGAR